MELKELEEALKTIDYKISRDMGDYRVIIDHKGNELPLVIWYDKKIEMELMNDNKSKLYIYFDKVELEVLSKTTICLKTKDVGMFINFCNYDKK